MSGETPESRADGAGRTLVAVVVGYVVMALSVMTAFTALYLALGPERAFRANSFEPSTTWILASLMLGFAAAWIGGAVCRRLARQSAAVRVLAGIVLVLGLVSLIPTLRREPSDERRTAAISSFEAMKKARQPTWVAVLNPIIGAAGVLLAASRRRD